jgi:hypothetical protein
MTNVIQQEIMQRMPVMFAAVAKKFSSGILGA